MKSEVNCRSLIFWDLVKGQLVVCTTYCTYIKKKNRSIGSLLPVFLGKVSAPSSFGSLNVRLTSDTLSRNVCNILPLNAAQCPIEDFNCTATKAQNLAEYILNCRG